MATDHRRSYWKTVVMALIAFVGLSTLTTALIAGAVGAGSGWSALRWGVWVVATLLLFPAVGLCFLVAAGGLISLRRDTLETLGRPYGPPNSSTSNERRFAPMIPAQGQR